MKSKAVTTTIIPILLMATMIGTSTKISAAEDIGNPRLVYELLLKNEIAVSAAIRNRELKTLDNAADLLGSIVDSATSRVRRGGKASECEMAAQSLANVAIAVSNALQNDSEFASIVLDGFKQSVTDFSTDMQNCEQQIDVTPREHKSVENAYEGLTLN